MTRLSASTVESHWPLYEPTDEAPWSLRRVVHLHRRAGMAAPWPHLQRDLQQGPHAAIDRLLAGQLTTAIEPTTFESVASTIGDAAVASGSLMRLKAWWTYRLLMTPDPLGERLALLWHNHFATSNRKVQNLGYMRQQNETFRARARGSFAELLTAVVQGPAMLVWLDADRNRAGHPNENLARELLELFTLGIGNYSEPDVQETARALTGWRLTGDELGFDATGHDDGEKTILTQSGRLRGDDVLALLCRQPATAQRIAWRLCKTFMGEDAVSPAAVAALGNELQQRELDLSWAIETILRSQPFFTQQNIATRVAGPPELVAGAVRALEWSPPPSTLLLAESIDRMGQELFDPPNVGGWSEGRAWLTPAGLIARANFAATLVDGKFDGGANTVQLGELVQRHAGTTQLEPGIVWLAELLYGGLPREITDSIQVYVREQSSHNGEPLMLALQLLLTRPEWQLA